MSDADVVVEEPNPTNEDQSIDNALDALYESVEAESVEAEAEAEADVEEEAPETEPVESEDEAGEEAEGEEFSLPENMPKELQESLAGLDEEVQKRGVEVFKKMQGSFTKKSQDFAEQKRLAENINQAFTDSGLNVGGYDNQQKVIGNYIAFEKLIASNPKAAVEQLMAHAKVKPEDLGITNPTTSSDDEYLTDEELNTRKQYETLEQKITRLENEAIASRNQAQQSVVDSFRNKTNEAGELAHPHFDAVKADMMDLADVNKTLTIDQLYNKAVRMNDELYNKTLEDARLKTLSEAEAKRKAEVDKAKKMNGQSLPVGSPKTQVVDEDAMFEQLAEASGWS